MLIIPPLRQRSRFEINFYNKSAVEKWKFISFPWKVSVYSTFRRSTAVERVQRLATGSTWLLLGAVNLKNQRTVNRWAVFVVASWLRRSRLFEKRKVETDGVRSDFGRFLLRQSRRVGWRGWHEASYSNKITKKVIEKFVQKLILPSFRFFRKKVGKLGICTEGGIIEKRVIKRHLIFEAALNSTLGQPSGLISSSADPKVSSPHLIQKINPHLLIDLKVPSLLTRRQVRFDDFFSLNPLWCHGNEFSLIFRTFREFNDWFSGLFVHI